MSESVFCSFFSFLFQKIDRARSFWQLLVFSVSSQIDVRAFCRENKIICILCAVWPCTYFNQTITEKKPIRIANELLIIIDFELWIMYVRLKLNLGWLCTNFFRFFDASLLYSFHSFIYCEYNKFMFGTCTYYCISHIHLGCIHLHNSCFYVFLVRL